MGITVVQKRKTKKTSKKVNSKEKQKYFRIIIVLLIICFSFAALGFAYWGLSQALFTKNEHFTVRKINVIGLDDRRAGSLIKRLGLTLGKDNLFDINIADLRRKIEKTSYIKSASVYRVLPDTLKINVEQRIPIAYLFKYRSNWVVDEDAIVMKRKNCMNLKYPLPVIAGFQQKEITTGEKLHGLTQAINLIKLTTYEFQKFKVSSIVLEDTEKIVFVMIKKRRAYKVLMPRNNLKDMMQVLRYALRQKQGKYKSTIDLTYNNQVIFR